MGSVGFPLKLSACILIFLILENFGVTCNNKFCYDKSDCGPKNWGYFGKNQSPINIDNKTVISDSSFGPLILNNYEDPKIAKKIWNTGRNLQIEFQAKATISSKGLSGLYYLKQAHIHWGTTKSGGAEHTINGKRYAMEMHLVHTKNNMNIEKASKQHDGFVIISFFIEETESGNEAAGWRTLAKYLKEIREKGNSRILNGEFNLGRLWSKGDLSYYFHYQGSLTFPPCAEAVRWIIFPKPLQMSFKLIQQFTSTLYFTTTKENRRMQNNFRDTQPLNGRVVYYYRGCTVKSLDIRFKLCRAE